MGPRPFSRRDLGEELGLIREERLQWGRDLSVAETATAPVVGVMVAVLQWGRDLSVAETRNVRPHHNLVSIASMGPRPFSRRDALLDALLAGGHLASMGPRPFSRRDMVMSSG